MLYSYSTDLMQRQVCMRARVMLLVSESGTPRKQGSRK